MGEITLRDYYRLGINDIIQTKANMTRSILKQVEFKEYAKYIVSMNPHLQNDFVTKCRDNNIQVAV